MAIKDFPDNEKEIIDVIAKTKYLKVDNDHVELTLESSNTLNIQPKENAFGLKITVEEDSSITPTLTFDTKKLQEKGKNTSPDEVVDQALKDYLENYEL